MKEKSTTFYGTLVLLECLLWGIGNPIVKILLESMPPFYCLSIRYAIAFLFFLPFFGKRVIAKMKKEHLLPYLIISVFSAAGYLTSNLAFMYTTATNTGFLMSTSVIFTPFISYFILKSHINKKHAFPIVIVTVGLYLLCSAGQGFSLGLGEAWALTSAVAAACMLVFSSKYIRNMDPFVTTTVQTGLTGLFFLIPALLFEDYPALSAISPTNWGMLIYLGIGSVSIAYLLQNIALRHVPANYVALAFCSEPVFTAIAAYFLLGEFLSGKGFIGAALIMIGIVLASLAPEKVKQESQVAL